MGLRKYRSMRELDETPEPGGGKARRGAATIFVVQLHHASHRHYDFRLQVGDVLKSWAVPKGPSYDPAVKRLAVEVEDHPLDYASFEGDIPEGHYGAGHVDIFDSGTWDTEGSARAQLAKGELTFTLEGKRLRGTWHLVRTKRGRRQPEWLLFKGKDEYAQDLDADAMLERKMKRVAAPTAHRGRAATRTRAAAKPKRQAKSDADDDRASRVTKAVAIASRARKRRTLDPSTLAGARRERIEDAAFAPQLAQVGSVPPEGDAWAHEVKWDGYRLLTTIIGGKVRLWSRNAIEWTQRLPQVVKALESLGLRSARLDGELVALFEGRADFNLLQAALAGETDHPLTYVLFDVPHFEGWALADVALVERKALLESLLADAPAGLRYSEHHVGDGPAAFALAEERGLEGILSKRVDSHYHPYRSPDWLKVRTTQSEEFAVIGYTQPKGSRQGVGALLLARATPRGGLSYVGRVGSGMTHAMLVALSRELRARERPTVPDAVEHLRGVSPRRVTWVEPRVIAEVYFRGYGKDGLLRQPSLKAIREDKTVKDLEHPERAAPASRGTARAPRERASTRAKHGADDAPIGSSGGVKLTSPDRVVFPDAGITKQQVFDYYAQAAPLLLEDIANRPLSIVRCPDGIGSACFFQKHRGAAFGPHVRTVKIREESGKRADYIYVDEVAGVLELVQMNVLEFHPWGARIEDTDACDRLVFDLDPSPEVPWLKVRRAARLVRERLEAVGLVSYLRTSGGKGLHVVVPLKPAVPWDEAKAFARAFAEALAHDKPREFVAVAGKHNRRGMIFVDYLRNSRGATSVASYSLRARPHAGVAMPLSWGELARLSGGDAFDLTKALKRIARAPTHPWADIDRVRQDLSMLKG